MPFLLALVAKDTNSFVDISNFSSAFNESSGPLKVFSVYKSKEVKSPVETKGKSRLNFPISTPIWANDDLFMTMESTPVLLHIRRLLISFGDAVLPENNTHGAGTAKAP